MQLEFEDKYQEKIIIDSKNLPAAFIKVPRQINPYDSGIYTLHNIELILKVIFTNDFLPFSLPSTFTKTLMHLEIYKISYLKLSSWIDFKSYYQFSLQMLSNIPFRCVLGHSSYQPNIKVNTSIFCLNSKIFLKIQKLQFFVCQDFYISKVFFLH